MDTKEDNRKRNQNSGFLPKSWKLEVLRDICLIIMGQSPASKYYNTEGKVVREYVETPLELPSMATLDLIVGQKDRSGGSGANFIVEWVAETEVTEPIVECIMIGTSGQQGISFLTVGKVIQ